MQFFKKEIHHVWLKAAVIGSLWGSFEIIAGSFFHNIKMPLAGTVLAAFSVILISAFGQIWKDKGLFWRSGLICALMKSVSPSAVLIGPMTGIFLEALLFEIAVTLFGRNFLGFILGGIFAMYSVIVHKVITLLIIYGNDLIKITENFYYFLIKQLRTEDLRFVEAFLLISSLYVLSGLIAALSGIYIGKRSKNEKFNPEVKDEIQIDKNYDFVQPSFNKHAGYLLIIHVVLIVLLLSLINYTAFYISVPVVSIYVLYVIFSYKRSIRYMKKPGFWIQILIFVLISCIFYNGINTESFFTEAGIEAGIKMGMRAIMIVLAFSAISTELRNPLIKALLFRRGFWQLYTSLGLAFSVLPFLTERSASARALIRNPLRTVVSALANAERIYIAFKNTKSQTRIYAVTGNIHQGKTQFTEQLVDRLKKEKIIVKGFLAKGKFENNIRTEFFIQDIQSGQNEKLCTIKAGTNPGKTDRFLFLENGLNFGCEILDAKSISPEEIIVIDEVGPYELKGLGWSNALELLLKKNDLRMIWVVRNSLMYDIFRRFGIVNAVIFNISEDSVEESAHFIIKEMQPA
jgi:nucleoside-triphosphatase THEP1